MFSFHKLLRYYTAKDNAGNVGTAERQVQVKSAEGGEIIWVADGGNANNDSQYINHLESLGFSVDTLT